MAELAIMVGLPRSGKSTFCKQLMTAGYVVVNPDRLRLALHGQAFATNAEPFVWATAEVMVRMLLMQGHNVVLDATNTHKQARSTWTRMAREFETRLDIFWVNTPIEVCLERNVGAGAVPEEVIRRMHRNFQSPSDDEGVIRVIGEDTKYA